MTGFLLLFKSVSIIFAGSAIVTGAQGVFNPIGFSRSFGIPIIIARDAASSKPAATSDRSKPSSNPSVAYVSLMGVRQLATGIILLTFAYQRKWVEIATILSILGLVVAGTDGLFLSRSGATNLAKLHAVPGLLIALLAGAFIFTNA